MIIGHGDIASAIVDRDDKLFFASGVSNSQELRETEYDREIKLLLEQNRQLHLVYFSSLCVFYSDNRYAQHKREQEQRVKSLFSRYTIIRLGNIDWGTNPHTLINYLKNRSAQGQTLEIQNVYRYVINKNEFQYWTSMIPTWNCEMNITGERLKVSEIVEKYVRSKHPNSSKKRRILGINH